MIIAIIITIIILGVIIICVAGVCILSLCSLIIWLLALWIGSNRIYTEQDFYDSGWENTDGAVVNLYKDGTCNVHDMMWEQIFLPRWPEDSVWMEKYPKSFAGYWNISFDQYEKEQIYIRIGKTGYGIAFDIEDRNTLYYTVGDPDNCEYYKLKRIQ